MPGNTMVERFLLDKFYRMPLDAKAYDGIDALQSNFDDWLAEYNQVDTHVHHGRCHFGKIAMRSSLTPHSWRTTNRSEASHYTC
jgi:hypothetical protein